MKTIAPFPYYGGKAKLTKWIRSHCPGGKKFVDIFGGSGVVALALSDRYKNVVYNDIHERVVNFYRVLRERPDELQRVVDNTPYSRREYAECAAVSEDPVEDARRTFVRINQSFSALGLRDVNDSMGTWSPSYGPCENKALRFRRKCDALPAISQVVRNWEIENLDWRVLVEKYDSESTCFFADPPYDLDVRKGKGYAHEFNESDHRALALMLECAKGSAIVCGYRSDLYDDIYADWVRVDKDVKTTAAVTSAANNDVKGTRVESLWIKNT